MDHWKPIVDAEVDDMAAQAFLELMAYLKIVLLQDAVVLMSDPNYKEHEIWNHTIFKSQEFQDFKHQSEIIISENLEPADITLVRAMPQLVAQVIKFLA